MLRSRSNRKQFPSESTDERHGYNGYPSHQPKSPLAVTIGCDDDIESHNYVYNTNNNRNYHHHSSPGGTVISMNGGSSSSSSSSSINNFSNSSGGVVRRSPSNGANVSGNHAAAAASAAAANTIGGCSSPMASAGSPIMGGGGIGPSNNNTYRRTLPGYGNHPNPSSGPTSSSSSFTERLTGISSPSMKSPRQLHLQQQQQHYARVRRMKLFIGGLALLASVYCLVLKLRGGSEWDTTMDQYRATMQRMIPAQEMMMASWKALISSGKGNDDAASSVDGDEEGDDNHSHYHHDQQNHHHHHHQQQQQQQDAIVDPLKQVLEQLQHQKQQMESEIQLLREKYHKMNSEVQLQQEQLNGVQLKIKEEEIKLIEYHKENSNNEKDRIVREKQLVLQQQEQQQREDALRDRIKLLSDNLGKESRRAVLESFGPGPHVVELFLEFPQYHPNVELDSWPRVRGKLTLEMAPLDLMPVSVNLFLQQIHHKLWNGCAFVINAEHILQAGPHLPSSDGKEYTLKSPEILNRFRESGLMELPFQEYQEEYPHEQYTIGYAGRPGGLNWYINKVNNTLNHGPGGQRHYNSMIDEADPCFAKVVSGWDVLEYIEKLPVENARLVRPLVIADSRVIISRTSEQQQPQQQ